MILEGIKRILPVLIIPVLSLGLLLGGCSETASPPGPASDRGTSPASPDAETFSTPLDPSAKSKKEITLDDAPYVLDISAVLPSRFEHVDAASEGLSNKDLELGPEFSEVELFLSEDPFQMIYGTMSLLIGKIEIAGNKSVLKNEELLRSLVLTTLEEIAIEEGLKFENPEVHISNPDIGEIAVLASGKVDWNEFTVEYGLLMFIEGKVFICITQANHGSDLDIVPIGRKVLERIEEFEH